MELTEEHLRKKHGAFPPYHSEDSLHTLWKGKLLTLTKSITETSIQWRGATYAQQVGGADV
jgi:hypothetical protein